MSTVTKDGVRLRHDDGRLTVLARPSEVPPDQLTELRTHKAELLPILAAFGTAVVTIRPATPVPDEPKLGDWVWRQPLPPRRKVASRPEASGVSLRRAGEGR